jgi:hypothetical protein
MALTLTASNLVSREIRKTTTGNSTGIRKIDFSGNVLDSGTNNGIGGAVKKLWNGSKRFGGWLFRAAKWIGISITGVFDWLVERSYELAYFDWNQTDAQLRESLASGLESLARTAGGLVGSGLGWLFSAALGFGLSLVFPVIGGATLARFIASTVLAEGTTEILGRLKTLFTQSIGLTARYIAVETYISTRKLLLGENAGKTQKEPWTIAGAIEESVQAIPNRYLRAFTEGLIDEGVESFIEGGYIIASELEAAWAARNGDLEPEKGVYLQPNADSSEKFLIQGTTQEAKARVLTVLDQSRLIGNRDLGYFVGDIEDSTIQPPIQKRSLVIHYRHKDAPPYPISDANFRKGKFIIPDLKTGISWEELKQACRPFVCGRYRITAFLDSGRQMVVFASSKSEGQTKIRELLRLTTSNVLRWSSGELEDENALLRKKPQTLWASKAYFFLKTKRATPGGLVSSTGDYFDVEKFVIPLYLDEKPQDYPVRL